MKIFLADELHKVDAKAIKEFKIPELVLMENAGRVVKDAAAAYLQEVAGKSVVVLCGKGNNGGDGLVAARLLANAGNLVTVVLLEKKQKFSPSTLVEYEILEHCSVQCRTWSSEEEVQQSILDLCLQADLIIDAMLGTGFKGKLKGSYQEIIESLSMFAHIGMTPTCLAVDIPSGVEADTGKVDLALPAALTVTMMAPKLGLYLYPGANYSGDIVVANLGQPPSLLEEMPCQHGLLEEHVVETLLPHRPAWSHKGMNGRVALLAGSPGYAGAAALASNACVRAGAGLVHLYAEEQVVDVLTIKLTEVMVEKLETNFVAKMLLDMENYASLGVGPGLGKSAKVQKFLLDFLPQVEIPVVLDADGLNAFAGHAAQLKAISQKILTPHPAELARLLKVKTEEIVASPVEFAKSAAKKFAAVVLLKTVPALVATPAGDIYLNTTGNEGMATGGTGDVLTGVITGFLGQGLEPLEAALAGMYIHGLAGDLAAPKGKIGMCASDVVDYLPRAMDHVLASKEALAIKD